MIVVLSGTNQYLIKAELKQLVDSFVAKHGDLALEKLDGEETTYNRVSEAVQSLPFLATHKMVVLKSAAANKSITEKVEQLLADVPDSTDLIIVEGKLDKRGIYYKTLKKLKGFRERGELDEHALAKWLSEQATARGGTLKLSDAQFLVQRVGLNQMLLGNELEKLISYEPTITREAIVELTELSPQSTVFELMDAAFAGNHKRAMELYREQRQQKVEPQAMLALVVWQLHVLALIKAAGQRSPDAIATESKVNPFVLRKSVGLARRLSMGELKSLIKRTLDLDVRLKSAAIDADEALQNLLLSLG